MGRRRRLSLVLSLTLAALYCDRIVLMDSGRVVASGSAAEVLTTANISRAYGANVRVLQHDSLPAPVIIPYENGSNE